MSTGSISRAELLRRRLSGVAKPAADSLIAPVARGGPLPLSFAQRRLWVLDQIQPGTEYLMPLRLRLRGPLDLDALRAVLLATIVVALVIGQLEQQLRQQGDEPGDPGVHWRPGQGEHQQRVGDAGGVGAKAGHRGPAPQQQEIPVLPQRRHLFAHARDASRARGDHTEKDRQPHAQPGLREQVPC